MPTENPMIAFDCGECLGRGYFKGKSCDKCFGFGKLRISIDDLAQSIADKIAQNLFCDRTVISDPYYTPPDECPPVLPEPV